MFDELQQGVGLHVHHVVVMHVLHIMIGATLLRHFHPGILSFQAQRRARNQRNN